MIASLHSLFVSVWQNLASVPIPTDLPVKNDDRARVAICEDTSFNNCQILFDKYNDFPDESVSESIEVDKLVSTAVLITITNEYLGGDEFFYMSHISSATTV